MTARDEALAVLLEHLAEDPHDERAWQLLFDRMWPYVLSITFRKLRGERRLAEDAAQEVFLRLLHYGDFTKLRQPDAFRSYLAVIATNVVVDARTKLTGETALDVETAARLPETAAGTIERRVEVADLLEQAFATLDDDERRLAHWVIQGYARREIAALMNISESNANVRVHRLRKRLLAWPALHDFHFDL